MRIRTNSSLLLAGVSLVAVGAPVAAQTTSAPEGSSMSLEEIVVTARRKEESLQSVPQTVNVVTSEQLEKLNVRNFTDIESLVPGLTLRRDSAFSTQATVRGVAFNPEASGLNQTVEFYFNDAPVSSTFLFQSLFDLQQFELLRGPQGTLRGRASPSGSITVSARRPDLSEMGVVVNATATDSDAYKGDFAVNIPLVDDMLAVRIAGVYDEDEGDQVTSIKRSRYSPEPFRETKAGRVSVRFTPTDWLDLNLMYQTLEADSLQYQQVQSASLVNGSAPSGRLIGAFDHLGIEDTGRAGVQEQDTVVLNADVRVAGQKISYVGSYAENDFAAVTPQDNPDFFADPRFAFAERAFRDPAGREQVCQQQGRRTDTVATTWAYFQCTHGDVSRQSHELRLASEERIGGMFDYLVGVLYDKNKTPSRLTQETPLLSSATPPTVQLVNLTAITRDGDTEERSVFANLTAHFGEQWELSGGARYIDYHSFSSLISGTSRPTPDQDRDYNTTIFTGSLKYAINDAVMAYASVGTSWRPGAFAVGDFNLRPTAREISFFDLPPEESTSYELGLKTSFLDGRARANLTVFHQEFDDYVYRGPTVYYVNFAQQGANIVPAVNTFNFVAAVPVEVDGVELEASYLILPQWNVAANFAYADGQIKDGLVACTDLNADGVPDQSPARPTLAQLQAITGADNLSQCRFNGRATFVPKWTANLQTEATMTLASWSDVFARALYTYNTKTERDPFNPVDDVSAYGIFNLYTGLRDPDGKWEVSLFAKNLFETERVLSRSDAPLSSTLRTTTGGSVNYTAPYYSITTTSPREYGISFRLALGSR